MTEAVIHLPTKVTTTTVIIFDVLNLKVVGHFFKDRRFLSGTFLILVSTIWTSCNNQINFDSRKWKIEEDLRTYPFRETMIEDIIQNKKFIGLNLGQVRDTLGQPNALENGQLFYSITTDYGTDIDPIYTKDLVLTFDNDSLITDIKIKEWKK